jgi:hypothetical protein
MMKNMVSRRTVLKSATALAVVASAAPVRAQSTPLGDFLLTNPPLDSLTFLAEDNPEITQVAPSPWGAAVGPNGRAYVSLAQELAIVDTETHAVTSTVPYRTVIEQVGYGEYRSGGMGIAVTPDGRWVAVGIHMNGSNGLVELYDVQAGAFVATVPVGVRPFDVVSSPDSTHVYSIDHDSFTITAIELASQTATTIEAAPLGYGEFDKPHYAAILRNGTLVLPYVGQLLWMLDPATGESMSLPMTADTHQHGITVSSDESTAFIVGTGPAGPAQGPPSLTVLNLESGEEFIIELELPHEQVVLTEDETGAILTGGYTFADGGWDGITRIDLPTGRISTLQIDGRPLAIQRLP